MRPDSGLSKLAYTYFTAVSITTNIKIKTNELFNKWALFINKSYLKKVTQLLVGAPQVGANFCCPTLIIISNKFIILKQYRIVIIINYVFIYIIYTFSLSYMFIEALLL